MPPLSRARGLLHLVTSAVLFGIMAYVAKKATRVLDGAQVALVRFLVGVLVVGVQAFVRQRPLAPKRFDLLFLRGFFGGLAVLLYFLAIARLPVGTATLLNYTSPVFTAAFAWLFLREVLPRVIGITLAITGVGVTLVVLGQGQALGGDYLWQLIALVSAVASGFAVTAIRAARRTDGPWEVFGAFCVVGALVTAPFAVAHWRWPSLQVWGLLVAVGLISAGAQVLMTYALGAVEAATSGITNPIAVVVALGLGTFLDGEPFAPLSMVGGVLTLVGVTWATRETGRATRREQAERSATG